MVTGVPGQEAGVPGQEDGAGRDGRDAGAQPPGPAGRQVPPVIGCAVTALILVVAGGIDLAAYLPRPAPLAPAVAALAGAVLALLAALAALSRARDFAWGTFRMVSGWTLAVYAVVAGMLEFVFVLDGTPAALLTVLSLMLAVFAVDISLLLAFSVARYQHPQRG
jgi:hypothetical protein